MEGWQAWGGVLWMISGRETVEAIEVSVSGAAAQNLKPRSSERHRPAAMCGSVIRYDRFFARANFSKPAITSASSAQP